MSAHQAELGRTPERAMLKLEGLAARPDIPLHILSRVHRTDPSVVPEGLEPTFPCPMGLTNCGGDCVDLNYDPEHCGACDIACETEVCVMGLCAAPPVP